MISENLKEKINNLSYNDQDDVYRYLWSKHVYKDVQNHAIDLDVDLDDDDIDCIVERYVYNGDYDCNISYWSNIENLINEYTIYDENHFNVPDVIDSTIISIRTDNKTNERFLCYKGYGYNVEDDDETPYRFMEYTSFEAPLKDVLREGVNAYEDKHCTRISAKLDTCTRKDIWRYYRSYTNNVRPNFISSNDINESTPDGIYLIS